MYLIKVTTHKTAAQYGPKLLVLTQEVYGALMRLAAYRLEKQHEYLICYQSGRKADTNFMVKINDVYKNVHDLPSQLRPNNIRVSMTTHVHAQGSAEDQSRMARLHMHSQRTQIFNYIARLTSQEVVASQQMVTAAADVDDAAAAATDYDDDNDVAALGRFDSMFFCYLFTNSLLKICVY